MIWVDLTLPLSPPCIIRFISSRIKSNWWPCLAQATRQSSDLLTQRGVWFFVLFPGQVRGLSPSEWEAAAPTAARPLIPSWASEDSYPPPYEPRVDYFYSEALSVLSLSLFFVSSSEPSARCTWIFNVFARERCSVNWTLLLCGKKVVTCICRLSVPWVFNFKLNFRCWCLITLRRRNPL